ncbi:hypothetical protein [Undibacterium sp.]|jgi:hypothetical protein|uniref:hypothetical protein n=1 Tax=Undibacterium sp. TaxID=1914977 RepID=UPI002CFFDADE|nr:hypothetical protein [Undibacterium sp.]HTD04386.1 hypothetical protein [Undibacterium sp.]
MPEKSDHAIQNAVSAATSSLVAFAICVAAFLPPASHTTLHSTMLTVIAGLGIGISCILHFVFVGLTAQRTGRSVALWVFLALISFPLGSIIGLILLSWLKDEQQQAKPGEQ